MAYTDYDPTTPVDTDDGNDVIDNIKNNQNALMDMIVGNFAPGWDMAITGSETEPTTIVYVNGTNGVQLNLYWGTTGGEDGNVTDIVFKRSTDSGVSYPDTMATVGITYNNDSIATATLWS